MQQIAVFVDAGYLIAEGTLLVNGQRQPRGWIRLDVDILLGDLRRAAASIDDAGRLLRIYWYDGLARRDGMSLEQQRIAQSRDVKARFGRVNVRGEQKGVDSLLVTDLIELARVHAIGDALIVAGDEDIRVGLAIAQSHGVRVHLLGVQPVRDNQSFELQAEADTLLEWKRDEIARWLESTAPGQAHRTESSEPGDPSPAPPSARDPVPDLIAAVVAEQVAKLDAADVDWVLGYIADKGGRLPFEFDAPSLSALSARVGRMLVDEERKAFRSALVAAVEALRPDQPAQGS